MIDEKKAQELYGQLTGKATEAATAWAEANQRVLRELVDLQAAAAKEGVRLWGELQQGALEALRDSQAGALRWQSAWPEAVKDPVGFYQQAVLDGVETAQKAFRLLEGQTQAVTRSAERLQASAEQAGRGIQETYKETVARLKDLYAQN